jgi:hypothetical protein
VKFDLSQARRDEIDKSINNARSAFAPGPNGVPNKIYKKCMKFLWRLLRVVWRQEVVLYSFGVQREVYTVYMIPKEE